MTRAFGVGAVVIAKRDSGVCRAGERGVCYEVYDRGDGTVGHGVLFERGGYDGFSPEDVELFLELTGIVVAQLEDYQFEHVGGLLRDYRRGVFRAAFERPAAIA